MGGNMLKIADPENRKKVIEALRRDLVNVAANLEAYFPDGIILEGSTFTVEAEIGHATIVHCDFKHMGSI